MRDDLTGRKFGKLTVTRFSHTENKRTYWHCRCACGGASVPRADHLKGGKTRSCGCDEKGHTKHGWAGSQEYNIWIQMRQRCENPNHPGYKNYGGRGIRVCVRWHTFDNFIADMGSKPEGHSIERDNVNGWYAPDNCRWIPRDMQNSNTRRSLKNRTNI